MTKKKIANIPFGPFISVLAGATVNGKTNYATIGAYGVVSQKNVLYISLKKLTLYNSWSFRKWIFYSKYS
ncbi:hypothetical protein DZE42_001622 [Clostridium beijerinckii]|nr:hypothetical protein [Clostridium beijerinckii]